MAVSPPDDVFHLYERARRGTGVLDRQLTFSSPAAYSCDFRRAEAHAGEQAPSSKGFRTLRYLFEDYALDPERRELCRGADTVSVAPQVFDLLDYLNVRRQII
jgi:hypothetical protein